MKILITTGIFPPDIGGPATYVCNISDEFVARGHEVKVITYSDKAVPDDESYEICRVIRSKNLFWRYFKYWMATIKRAWWADVIYVQDPVSAGLPVVMANIFWRKKIILKIVGDFAWEQAQNQYDLRDSLDVFQHQKYDSRIEFWRRVEHFVAKKAFFIITPSNYLKRVVRCWGIDDEKIKVIYNSFEKPAQVDEVDMPDGDIILTAGRLVAWKGVDTLIQIMPDLLNENSKFKLMVVGDGPEKKNLENMARGLGLERKVIFKGQQPRERLLGYLKKSYLFILNSSYEGLSHLILEAIWSGIPIAVSRVGGNPELIQDGKNGILFDYNNKKDITNAILKINKEIIAAGNMRLSDDFSFSRMIDSTINIFKSVV